MGQREVLTVHEFSVLSCPDQYHMTISWAQINSKVSLVKLTADDVLDSDWIAGSCLLFISRKMVNKV